MESNRIDGYSGAAGVLRRIYVLTRGGVIVCDASQLTDFPSRLRHWLSGWSHLLIPPVSRLFCDIIIANGEGMATLLVSRNVRQARGGVKP